MKRYVGVKIVNAKEMPLGVYNQLQGWTMSEDQDPNEQGFLVEYLNGGAPNHKDYEGYISWCPKPQFEDQNREITGLSFEQVMNRIRGVLSLAKALI